MTDSPLPETAAPSSSGRSAFITGGSKGIGYAVAEALLHAGYRVTVTSRNEGEVQAAASRLNQEGPGEGARGVACDVRDMDALQAAVDAHVLAFGGLDLLFVNAGVGHFGPVQELSPEQWREVIDTNLSGAFYTVRAAVPALTRSKGYVITLGSLAGKNPFPGGSAYNASKFGLNGFSEVIMQDLRPLGIRVSQIMPGSVATQFGGHTPDEGDAWKIQPQDIAQLVVDLTRMPERTLPSRLEVRPAQPKKG